MQLILLLVLPIIVALVWMFCSKGKITLKEFFLMEVITVLVVSIGYWASTYVSTSDTEIISGRIQSRTKDRVSCSHSYTCNCTTSCDSKGNCSTTCSTCYEHSYDVEWNLHITGGLRDIGINTIDRQGLDMPPRWGAAYIGEPVAEEHTFDNYIKANPGSLLRRQVDINKYFIPVYPNSTFDYYKLDRFLNVNYVDPQHKEWSWLINEINGDLGPAKHANVIVVAVKTADEMYEYALEDKWVLGKKNDVIVLLGVPEYPKISWARVISWSKSEDMKVELRDEILRIGDMRNRDDISKAIRTNVQNKFIRRHGSDFKYLVASMQPSQGWMIFLFITGLAVNIGGCWYMQNVDVFGDEN